VLDFMGTIEAVELADGQLVVSAHGPLDERVAGTLRDALVPLAGADRTLVLDLDDAHGLDGAVLAVVARAAELVRSRGDRMSIVSRSPATRTLIHDTGLDDDVDVYSSLKEALRLD
jgi:anti-anti-sigma factor